MPPREIKDVSYDFSGRVVMVTGAARGQGRSHALGFAAAGADLIICDIAAPIETVPYEMGTDVELAMVAQEIEALGRRCHSATCDVGDANRVDSLVSAAVEQFGRIDVLINNAGANSLFSLVEMSTEAWDAVMNSQLRGTFNCSRAVAPTMIGQGSGRILITGSTASFKAAPRQSHYIAAKHGMLGLMKAMALEFAPKGIKVTRVCPGALADTGMVEGMSAAGPEWLEEMGALTGSWNLFDPTGMLEPQEVTNALLWLASDGAEFITGAALPIDAGFGLK
jgi:NAD(P)-dependent dehydrogenase (short-subunit alcohol dehydrogenase family)